VHRMSPLLAQSRHPWLQRTCPLLRVKRTWISALHMSAYDPKRTLTAPHGIPQKLARHREQTRLMPLGLFKATQIWALHWTQRTMKAGIGGVGSSATRWQTRSSRDHCVRNCAIACSRLVAYPRSDSDRLRSWAMITQNQGASIGACGWRTTRPTTLSPSHTS
jgi:hypothetical protein